MSFNNVVLFGAGGTRIGHHILQALVADGSFNVTVLARQSSNTQFPPSINVLKIQDSFPHNDVVAALKGQDALISTSGLAAHDVQYRLIDAAIDAGVTRFMPSEWGMDNADRKNQDLCPIFKLKAEVAEYLHTRESELFSWTAVASSIWLDWALDVSFIGVDPISHTAQYWCNGTHTPSHTTLPYCAQAMLQILKHPDAFKNQRVFLSPFQASQREIVAELETMQGVKYQTGDVDNRKIVLDAQKKWESERDANAAYTLVSAGVLLPQYGADFVTCGKVPLLEDLVEMPKLSLEMVVKTWVEQHPDHVEKLVSNAT